MKRIKFTELGFKKNLDTLFMCLGFICLVIGLISNFGLITDKLKILSGLSVLMILYPQTKNLFYRNYIFWNKKGGGMKLNSKSFSFQFDNIRNVAIENENLHINLKNGSTKDFSIKNINVDDLNYLLMIFKK